MCLCCATASHCADWHGEGFCPAQLSASPCIIEYTVPNQDAFAAMLKWHPNIILLSFDPVSLPSCYRQSPSFPIPFLLFGDSLPLHDGTSDVPSEFVLCRDWYRLLPRRPRPPYKIPIIDPDQLIGLPIDTEGFPHLKRGKRLPFIYLHLERLSLTNHNWDC